MKLSFGGKLFLPYDKYLKLTKLQHHQAHGRSLQAPFTGSGWIRRRNVSSFRLSNTIVSAARPTSGDANCLLALTSRLSLSLSAIVLFLTASPLDRITALSSPPLLRIWTNWARGCFLMLFAYLGWRGWADTEVVGERLLHTELSPKHTNLIPFRVTLPAGWHCRRVPLLARARSSSFPHNHYMVLVYSAFNLGLYSYLICSSLSPSSCIAEEGRDNACVHCSGGTHKTLLVRRRGGFSMSFCIIDSDIVLDR